ncbi:NAD(P)-dependent oxidoreductase [Rummeliibacillus sp. NPDC094406]|uniref:NAD(P)-dependent oxidoreductase n=1 Tax=Rummeliibacillus sp. NPDC094406 TaxID=3364511 RepID=UPI003800B4BA
MKIVVFGASGRVGQHVVRLALEKGIEVTAFVRTPSKLQISHPFLHIYHGNALQADDVATAIKGQNAVVSCLASSKGLKESTELSKMIENIVLGMQTGHVNRIVYTASAGIDGEIPGISGKMVMKTLKYPLLDHRHAVDTIMNYNLDYTIVRPMGLTNEAPTGIYREAIEGIPEKGRSIARVDVANFILKALEDPKYSNLSISIAN